MNAKLDVEIVHVNVMGERPKVFDVHKAPARKMKSRHAYYATIREIGRVRDRVEINVACKDNYSEFADMKKSKPENVRGATTSQYRREWDEYLYTMYRQGHSRETYICSTKEMNE